MKIAKRSDPNSLRLVNDQSQPNINEVWTATKDMDAIRLNIKTLGYELARSLAARLPQRTDLTPVEVGLRSKASTQADLESDWVAFWLSELKVPVVFHRKLWELAYVLQAIYESGHLREGQRGLGFGCGAEPIPSYLAAHGVNVTITDLPPARGGQMGWVSTNQHAGSLDAVHMPHLVDKRDFVNRASLRFVDMNAIPRDLTGYDFCWSICAFEHLGSIEKGLDFVENSLRTLKPGGLAVHTTEFNFWNDAETIDNWTTVLFQKRHFTLLAERLRRAGHHVAELDFDVGDKPLDKFIDIPPYLHDLTPEQRRFIGEDANHIKLTIDGFPSTCFALKIVKA